MRIDRSIRMIVLATVMTVTAWLAAADWARADHELPRAAFSHSASVGNRLPAHLQYASASYQLTCMIG